jgi:hypothetical protein
MSDVEGGVKSNDAMGWKEKTNFTIQGALAPPFFCGPCAILFRDPCVLFCLVSYFYCLQFGVYFKKEEFYIWKILIA